MCCTCASEGSYEDYVEFIKALPQAQAPEVFGMHENVDMTRELSETRELFNSVLLTLGKVSGSAGGRGMDTVNEVAADILRKLPKEFELDKAIKKYPVVYSESMNTVLVQEMERFNKCANQQRCLLTTYDSTPPRAHHSFILIISFLVAGS